HSALRIPDGFGGADCCSAMNIHRSNHVTVQRVCAWDAADESGTGTIENLYGANNLFEDICIFGAGRKSFDNYSTPGPITVRRAWAMWNRGGPPGFPPGTGTSPREVFGAAYLAYLGTFENVIGTWSTEQAPTSCCPYTVLNIGDGANAAPTSNF